MSAIQTNRIDVNEWPATVLGAVCDVNPKRSRNPDPAEVSFIPMASVEAEQGAIHAHEVRSSESVRKGYTRFEDGDVIFAKITPCMENGKSAIATGLTGGVGYGSTEFHVLRPGPEVLSEWVFHFVRQQAFRNDARDNFTGTAGQARVPTDFMRNAEIPLPPLDEQQRIVSILRRALADIREGKEALARVPAQMKRFRQSVLAQAFRGELTADWRAEHADRFREAAEWFDAHIQSPEARTANEEITPELLAKIPPEVQHWLPGDRLLQVILAERRAKWERVQIAKPNPKARIAKSCPSVLSQAGLITTATEFWDTSSLGALTDVQGGIQKQPSRAPKNFAFPFLRVANVHRGRLDLTEMHQIELLGDIELERLRLLAGDLLIVEGNGSPSEIGRMAVWDGSVEDCVHQNHLIRARPATHVLPEWIEGFWNSPEGIEAVEFVSSSTSGLHTLSVGKVSKLPIPVASMAEQSEIVARIKTIFAEAESTNATAARALTNLRRLEQSTLQAAFRGDL